VLGGQKGGSVLVDERLVPWIDVPPGDESDPTRTPAFYDDTYEYLTALGVAEA
jgi:hypothetical protein